MAVDGLAAKLELLLGQGAIAAGRLTIRERDRLQGLFESGVLAEERGGGGRRVVVGNHAALAAFVARLYPSGLAGIDGDRDLAPRSRAVAERRDAKKAHSAGPATVLLRGFGGCGLRAGDQTLPVAQWTQLAGVAALRLDGNCRWGFAGRLAVVENLEVFLHFENSGVPAQLALYAGGRLDNRVLAWLASPAMAGVGILHCGDYDPVGLDEYLRLQEACPGRTELYLPPDLEDLLQRYGKKDLLSDSAAVLARLRKCGDPQVRRVVEMMDRYGVGLEQEALLLTGRSAGHGSG
ncbi:MAG: hypothetical protein AB1568_15135 [Thermodesulfobacteriota bacterium]